MKMNITKMTYGLRIKDLSKKYFGDLVSEDRMCIKIKPKKNETVEKVVATVQQVPKETKKDNKKERKGLLSNPLTSNNLVYL